MDRPSLSWITFCEETANDSVAVTEDRIFTAHSVSSMTRSIDKSTGDVLWEKESEYPVEEGIVTDGDRIYFGDSGGSFVALDGQTGAERWRTSSNEAKSFFEPDSDGPSVDDFPVEFVARFSPGNFSVNPTLSGKTVYSGTTGATVYAFDTETGKLRWDADVDEWVTTCPLVTGGRVFVGTYSGTAYAFDAEDGTELWTRTLDADIYGQPAAIDDDCILFAPAGEPPVGLDPENGDEVLAVNSAVRGSATTVDRSEDRVYVSGGRQAAAIDATGTLEWEHSFDGRTVAPVVLDDCVIFAGQSEGVLCVDSANGSVIWTLDLPEPIHTIEYTGTGLFVGDGDGGLQLYDV